MNKPFLDLRSAAFLVLAVAACNVSSEGLRNSFDGGSGGATGTAACPGGLTDQAGWPANNQATSCGRTCGPDSIGFQTCRRNDLADCRKRGGCVCLVEPCVKCDDCTFPAIPDCYVPANAATIGVCGEGVGRGEGCAPPCGKEVCLRQDGKTACLCNEQGTYACGEWGPAGWK